MAKQIYLITKQSEIVFGPRPIPLSQLFAAGAPKILALDKQVVVSDTGVDLARQCSANPRGR